MSTNSFCTECGSPLAAGARFCANCGKQIGSDLPAPAANVAAPSATASTASARALPTHSDIVYLFGDSFAPKDNWRSQGVVLENSAAKVQKKPLAEGMLLAAIAALVKHQWIDLQVVKTGILVFKQDLPVLRRVSHEPCRLGGLESAIVERIDGRGDQVNSVALVVSRLVGSDQFDPWANVFAYARDHLVETGLFVRVENPAAHGLGRLVNSPYRLEPQSALILEASSRIGEVRGLMDAFTSSRGRAWGMAARQIEQALKGAQSRDDGDDGDDGASDD